MKNIYLFVALVFLETAQIFAQTRVTGIVSDGDGETLPGVNVIIKGTTQGTITDINGNYNIDNVPVDGILEFSMVGMQDQEIKVNSRSKIDVKMAADVQSLDEVVVVGYGSVKRANLAGSVTDINARELQDIPSANLSTALEGRLAGVKVSQASGRPGAATKFQIRESSSNKSAEEPLFVIDGVIREDGGQAAFDMLDPSEVESISILKDASAAVYGARAAGGVVLVQTKRGKKGKVKVNYSSSLGITQAINSTEMLSAYEQAQMLNDGFDIRNFSKTSPDRYTADELDYFRDSIPDGGYDWLKEAWKNASVARHNLSVNGGSEKVSYFVGGNYYKETGSIEGLYVTKYTLRSNMQVEVLKGLTTSFEFSIGNRKTRLPLNPMDKESDILEETFKALLQNPQWIPPTIDGLPVKQGSMISNNPYAIWANNNYKKGESNNVNLIASVEYELPFIRGLRARVQVSQTKDNASGKTYNASAVGYNFQTSGAHNHIIMPDAPLDSLEPVTLLANIQNLEESSTEYIGYQYNAQLSYDKEFGKSALNALIVAEGSENRSNRIGWQRQNDQLVPGYDLIWAFAEGGDRILATVPSQRGSLGYIGRLNYNYGSKYICEFAFRYESSTRFPYNKRWAFFPSLLAGWVVSEEDFFENNVSFINFFKLRGSAGLLGNDQTGEFSYILRYAPDLNNYYLFGDQASLLVYPKNDGVVNPIIAWQKTQSYNGGMDLRFLDNKISFTADVFYKYTSNTLELLASMIPTTAGVPVSNKVAFNYGRLHAYGYEFELGFQGTLPFDFNYNISGNFSWAEAMLLKVAQSPGAVGKWYDQLKNPKDNQPGAVSTGIIRDQQELDDIMMDNPNYLSDAEPLEVGMLNYKDIRGTDGSEGPNGQFNFDLIEDRTVIARKTSPPYNYGVNFNLFWKGIRLDMTFSGKFGHKVLFDKEAMTSPTATQNVPAFWVDHWTPENIDAAYPRAYNYGLEGNYSTFWMRDGHTLRLTDMNISYSLPGQWAERVGLSQFRIYFNTKYLWTLINPLPYKDANLSKYNGYPMTRTYNFGISVNL